MQMRYILLVILRRYYNQYQLNTVKVSPHYMTIVVSISHAITSMYIASNKINVCWYWILLLITVYHQL